MYSKLRHTFGFSRNISEIKIKKKIANYLEANIFIRTDETRADINITSIENCENLIKFLDKYPLQSSKHQEYLIWREFVLKSKAFKNSNPKLRGNLDKKTSDFYFLIEKLENIRE
jgi:ABC-type transporter lipoprotein component MlaA